MNEHGTRSTAQEAEHELTSPPFVVGASGSPRRYGNVKFPRQAKYKSEARSRISTSY